MERAKEIEMKETYRVTTSLYWDEEKEYSFAATSKRVSEDQIADAKINNVRTLMKHLANFEKYTPGKGFFIEEYVDKIETKMGKIVKEEFFSHDFDYATMNGEGKLVILD